MKPLLIIKLEIVVQAAPSSGTDAATRRQLSIGLRGVFVVLNEDFPEDWDDEVLKQVEIDELMDTIAEAAKHICGTRPTDEQVKIFLEGIKNW